MTPDHTSTTGPRAATAVPLHPLLADRWSPRGFDAGHRLTDQQLTALLEAARWAPSAGNTQPWRFRVARRGDAAFDRMVALLAPGNRTWAPAASALVLVAAQVADETGRALPFAAYDAGQSVAALTVQAQALGLVVHQMGGFDAEGAAEDLGLPAHLRPLVVAAVGRHDPAADLPEDLAARERAPRTRAPLEALLLGEDRLARTA